MVLMTVVLVTTIQRFMGTAAEMAAMSVVGIKAGSTFFQTDTGLLYTLDSGGSWAVKTVKIAASSITEYSLQAAATANGDGTIIDVEGMATFVFDIQPTGGAFSATINFFCSVDGTRWEYLGTTKKGGSLARPAETASTEGYYSATIAGFKYVCANISNYVSGTITVNGYASPQVEGNKVVLAYLGAGTQIVGKMGIDQTTPGTTNKVVAAIDQSTPGTTNAVTLFGRNTMETTTHNALAITDTADNISSAIDVSLYKEVYLRVYSTLDNAAHNADPKIAVLQAPGGQVIADGAGAVMGKSLDYATYPPDARRIILSTAQLNVLNKLPTSVFFRVKCTNAPTSGSITVIMQGVKN